MGKVFRLHTGANTLEGWDDANAPYGTSAINQIKDPNGATSKKLHLYRLHLREWI